MWVKVHSSPALLNLVLGGFLQPVEMRKFYIYLIAVGILGLAYPSLKAALSGPLLIATVFVYCALARLTSEKLGR